MGNNWSKFYESYIPRIKARHYKMLHRPCEWNNPHRLTDKMEWLKVYDSTFLKTFCADKYTVRQYVNAKIGRDICIPLLGVYNQFDDIKFNELPSDYVMKTNHGSHTNIIVRNGSLNKVDATRKFSDWLSKDWSWYGYELHYIPIPRKIIIEEYQNDGGAALTDYKFLCFNGTPVYCQVIADRNTAYRHLNYYDMNWTPCTTLSRTDFPANYGIHHQCPSTFELMKMYAKILSADFKFVRVDFYEINNRLYFGELTFIPAAGYIQFQEDKSDYILGDMLTLM